MPQQYHNRSCTVHHVCMSDNAIRQHSSHVFADGAQSVAWCSHSKGTEPGSSVALCRHL
jgi:hypothetical protein